MEKVPNVHGHCLQVCQQDLRYKNGELHNGLS